MGKPLKFLRAASAWRFCRLYRLRFLCVDKPCVMIYNMSTVIKNGKGFVLLAMNSRIMESGAL